MRRRQIYEVNNLKLDNNSLLLNESLFYNANGYIGARSAFEEGYPDGYVTVRGQYINGFYDFTEAKQAECLYGLVQEKQTMLNIADTQSVKIYFDDECFTMFEGKVIESKRWVDMDKGVTGRHILWRSPDGKKVEITIIRMASLQQLSLFTIDITIKSINFKGEIKIDSLHDGNTTNFFDPNDPRTADEEYQYLTPICEMQENTSYVVSTTSKSNLTVCSGVHNVLSSADDYRMISGDCSTLCEMNATINEGETLRLIKYCVFADSVRSKNPRLQVEEEMNKALASSMDELYDQQEAYLDNYWKNCCVVIEGDDDLNTALQYNLFQLIQSVSKDEYGNISPKGLSGEGYEGQYFWDTEMYIQPFFTITNPDISKKLISYRYEILEMAKENAKILGHKKGALYPWRTIMGRECSGYFPAGTAQYHINGDIAYAIIAYYLMTNDIEFVASVGAEIIYETARLWMDVGNFHEGKFHINDVTGPDEYTCIVNNNYYTNVLVQYHLNWAAKLYYEMKNLPKFRVMRKKIKLSEDEVKAFEKAAAAMYLPYDEKLKINPQDDSFLQKKHWDIASIPKYNFPLLMHYHPLHLYRYQICKQPDTVLAHFILEDAQSEETIRNSFEYYEKITTHDSSLSRCIFSIVAAKLGMEEKAFKYFGDSTKLDLLDLHGNTKDGIHTANMGGNYMAIVYGFGGFRIKEDGLHFAPILPKKWTGYQFHICYHNSRIVISVSKEGCQFNLKQGDAREIMIYGSKYLLKDTLSISNENNKRRTL
ncbi:MAG: glycoside hydrolase family 65 protein [Clostridiales bacterium]|nr:glycoside hydrolase family 65 protein [Clostridiales bacterium]